MQLIGSAYAPTSVKYTAPIAISYDTYQELRVHAVQQRLGCTWVVAKEIVAQVDAHAR